MLRVLITAASAVALLACSSAVGARAPNDYLLVLDQRAGPYRYLDSFRRGTPGAYESARAAFGEPTRLRTSGNLCRVTWRSAGVTVGFASGPRPCSRAGLQRSAWDGITLHGARWHNRRGLRVGDPVSKVRRLYPNARAERPLGRTWLVLARRRVDEFNFIRLAVAVTRGRVAAIEVPAGYVF